MFQFGPQGRKRKLWIRFIQIFFLFIFLRNSYVIKIFLIFPSTIDVNVSTILFLSHLLLTYLLLILSNVPFFLIHYFFNFSSILIAIRATGISLVILLEANLNISSKYFISNFEDLLLIRWLYLFLKYSIVNYGIPRVFEIWIFVTPLSVFQRMT